MKPIAKWVLLGVSAVVVISGSAWWLRAVPSATPLVPPAARPTTCEGKKEELKQLISSRKTCSTDADCTSHMDCPFGCQLLVNKDQLAWLKGALAEYHRECEPECMYKCRQWAPVSCREGQCAAQTP
jgi:hypothetical protein